MSTGKKADAFDWAAQYGEPQDWALAQALLNQIRDFQISAAILQEADEKPPVPSIFAGVSAEQQRDSARTRAAERVRRPVVDVEAAKRAALGIDQQGGWGIFVGAR